MLRLCSSWVKSSVCSVCVGHSGGQWEESKLLGPSSSSTKGLGNIGNIVVMLVRTCLITLSNQHGKFEVDVNARDRECWTMCTWFHPRFRCDILGYHIPNRPLWVLLTHSFMLPESAKSVGGTVKVVKRPNVKHCPNHAYFFYILGHF